MPNHQRLRARGRAAAICLVLGLLAVAGSLGIGYWASYLGTL
jgi:hypothetical protein